MVGRALPYGPQFTAARASCVIDLGPPRHPALLTSAFQKLASHMDIGWDVDGTLINHPASPLLHQFILATPHIRHVIVTFRSERRHGKPWSTLASYRGAPGPAAFKQVIYMPDAMWDEFAIAREARQQNAWPMLGRLLRFRKPAWNEAYRTWKGLVCQREGVTALVDDLTRMVADGCQRHGVELFHPGDFLPTSASKSA